MSCLSSRRKPREPESSEPPMSAPKFVEMSVGTGASRVDHELEVGEALRWVGPGVWRVEEIAGDRVTLRLWPDNEPYPERIKEVGPGEWPGPAA